jgi:hypothetical protein
VVFVSRRRGKSDKIHLLNKRLKRRRAGLNIVIPASRGAYRME